jgi:hypothetical protein
MTTNRVKRPTGTYKKFFIAIQSIMQDLKHLVVKDQNQGLVSVMKQHEAGSTRLTLPFLRI